MKHCSNCGQTKTLSEFYRNKTKKGGLTGYCKQCCRASSVRYAAENAEIIRIRKAKYRAENVEEEKARHAKYRAENPEREQAYQAKYRAENSEKRQVYHAKYRSAHRDKLRAQENLYRAQKRNAKGNATADQIQAKWEVYGGTCYICGSPAEATDHVVPLAVGGSNWPANLRPICNRCNSSKRATWPYNFQAAKELVETRRITPTG